ncbi:MAG: Hsp70 family protein [Ardenticatenaceae bacterium]|nr:Hsp70 family protein [Ardenticatenaceae bacterium]
MSTIIGIDLGTTNSGVAIVQGGQPQMLAHGEERIIPSVVGYNQVIGKWLVGTPARNQYVLDPDNTVVSIKRKMGSTEKVTMGGRTFTPQAISAFILRQLKEVAERHLGTEVKEAVITVPAYFSDAQRQATRDAGRIAGLEVRRIINEPTAAALAYGLNLEQDKLVLVYDLGGGTFDVSLVELMGGIVEVRASHGDTQLGGDDFDRRLAELVAAAFEEEHGVDVRQDRRAWARMVRAAEQAKITLSDHPYAWLKEEYLAEKHGVPLHLEMEVSREEFETAVADLLDQTVTSIERVVNDAGVNYSDIDQVLLVGGSTYMPAVWELITNTVGIEPRMAIHPEEAVSLGAAVQAAIIEGQPIDAILVDVTPHSLGIAVAEIRMGNLVTDRYKVLIHRNTTIPVVKEDVFYTLHPDQDAIKIMVYQGEASVASHNKLLGDFLISDLEPEEPGELASVTVQFDFDLDGILHVRAQDRYTEKEEAITVKASLDRLDEAAVDAARVELGHTAVATLNDTAKALVERGKNLVARDDLTDEARESLRLLLSEIEQAQNQGQVERFDELLETLLDRLFDYE